MPISAKDGGCGTNDTYKDSWVNYREAELAMERRKADGVGFVIPKGMFFLDIDHRDLNGPMVREILANYNSYCEFRINQPFFGSYGQDDQQQAPCGLYCCHD